MADDKTTRPKITVGEKDEGRQGDERAPETVPPRDDAASGAADDERYGVGDAVRSGVSHVTAWVRRAFPGQEKAFWGAMIGLVAAIVFLAVGPWPLLVIAVFVFVGVAAGQVLDGDPKIVNTLRHLFDRNGQ